MSLCHSPLRFTPVEGAGRAASSCAAPRGPRCSLLWFLAHAAPLGISHRSDGWWQDLCFPPHPALTRGIPRAPPARDSGTTVLRTGEPWSTRRRVQPGQGQGLAPGAAPPPGAETEGTCWSLQHEPGAAGAAAAAQGAETERRVDPVWLPSRPRLCDPSRLRASPVRV